MRIPLDRQRTEPLYRQLEAHLRRTIAAGGLPPGARLPATRALARDLGVNRLTVETAYAGLEADGLLAARPGSGTYVLAAPPPPPGPRAPRAWPPWQLDLDSRRAEEEAAGQGEAEQAGRVISLARGLGDAALFPAEELRRVLQAVLRQDGAAALDYGPPAGHPGLRRLVAQVLASQGIPARPEDVLVTTGSQQALALVAGLLVRPGDVVLVERPGYPDALSLFRACGAEVVGVPVDGEGLRTDLLEPLLLRHRPRLLYTTPTFQNPTGASLPAARRRELLDLAGRHGLPVLEDDYVGDLRYEGRAQAPLKAWDRRGQVLYTSTFSKALAPGLRVGFVLAEGPVHGALVERKRLHDVATSSLLQRAVEAYVTVGRYQAHLRRTVRRYRRRRDALVEALGRHLPGLELTPPRGGLFLWARLPVGLSSRRLLEHALQAGVDFAPGARFFPDPREGDPYLRLNFAAHEPEVLVEAVRRLARAMRRAGSG
jgi:GntR family transcriptional regulator / MocR family aminotransferase